MPPPCTATTATTPNTTTTNTPATQTNRETEANDACVRYFLEIRSFVEQHQQESQRQPLNPFQNLVSQLFGDMDVRDAQKRMQLYERMLTENLIAPPTQQQRQQQQQRQRTVFQTRPTIQADTTEILGSDDEDSELWSAAASFFDSE